MTKNSLLSILFLFTHFLAFSQQSKIDSLWAILQSPDASKLPREVLYTIQKEYIHQTTADPAKRVEQLTRASLFFYNNTPIRQ